MQLDVYIEGKRQRAANFDITILCTYDMKILYGLIESWVIIFVLWRRLERLYVMYM